MAEQPTNLRAPLWHHVVVLEKQTGGCNVKWKCNYCDHVGTSSLRKLGQMICAISWMQRLQELFIPQVCDNIQSALFKLQAYSSCLFSVANILSLFFSLWKLELELESCRVGLGEH